MMCAVGLLGSSLCSPKQSSRHWACPARLYGTSLLMGYPTTYMQLMRWAMLQVPEAAAPARPAVHASFLQQDSFRTRELSEQCDRSSMLHPQAVLAGGRVAEEGRQKIPCFG